MLHPIEFRYGRSQVKNIFSETGRLNYILKVEAALAEALASFGIIPKKDAAMIKKNANLKSVSLKKVKTLEKKTKHEIAAIVLALAEASGKSGDYVHLGATSSDILDTALALQLKEYYRFFFGNLTELRMILKQLAKKYESLVCIGRTHGQHALPITYGFKFAIWAEEIDRHIERAKEVKSRILLGKMSGACGTHAFWGKIGTKIEAKVMKMLSLGYPIITSQILQRDRHAEFILLLTLVSSTLDKICTELRNLQRTEIGEVAEQFNIDQIGSSAMPQKRNPILAERVCGISRIIKGYATVALQNNCLWHERDLTNSSLERVVIPEACVLLDYILSLTIKLLKNLQLKPENINKNLYLTSGSILAEALVAKLFSKGLGRLKAYKIIRHISIQAVQSGKKFDKLVMENEKIRKYLTESEIKNCLDPKNYLGTTIAQIRNVVNK
jgi:adenylosuccinate lyase